MDFRLEGTRRKVNLSTFLLRGLRAERCDFGGGNRSGTGALSKHGFHPCPSIIRDRQRRIKTPSKSHQKTAFEVKRRLYTKGKVIQRLFIIDLYT